MNLNNYSFEQLSQLGRTAWKYGDWKALELIAKKMQQKSSDHAETEFLLGIAAKNLEGSTAAVQYFRRGLSLDKSRYDCAIELASACSAIFDRNQAFTLLQDYQQFLNNSPIYLNMAGTTYVELGLPREAFALYQRASELQPQVQLFKENLASCAVFLGNLSLATKLYGELSDLHPKHQRILYQLSRLVKARDKTLITKIEKAIADRPTLPTHNIFGYYAMAKQFEDLGDFESAFKQMELGSNAVISAMDYDLSTDTDILRAVKTSALPSDGLAKIGASNVAETPIFIIGLPRTGTTLLEQMLALHPEIESMGETNTIETGILQLSGHPGEPMSASILEQASNISPRLLKRYYLDSTAYRRKGLPYFVEKMPTNYQYLHLIVNAFPEAKILLVNRHPIDACLAMFKQLFTYAFRFSYSLEHLTKYYTEYASTRELWRRMYGDRLIELSYESLVTETETCLQEIFTALNLDFDPQLLSTQPDDFQSMTASSIQVKQKVSTDSVGKWKDYREYLTPLLGLSDH